MGVWSYKAGVGVALVAAFALGWSNMVHVADSEIRRPGVLQRARGGGRWGVADIAFGRDADLARNMAILHGLFKVLFTASGLLFRHASLARME
jgi:hypothetical protein